MTPFNTIPELYRPTLADLGVSLAFFSHHSRSTCVVAVFSNGDTQQVGRILPTITRPTIEDGQKRISRNK